MLFVLAAVAVIVVVRWLADRIGLPAAALLPIVEGFRILERELDHKERLLPDRPARR